MEIFLRIEFSLFVKIRFSGIVQQILVEISKNIKTQEQSLKLIKKVLFLGKCLISKSFAVN